MTDDALLSIGCRGSDRSNLGKPLPCVRVVPTDGGFPGGRRLRGDVVGAVVETGGVVVGDRIDIAIDIEAVRQAASKVA